MYNTFKWYIYYSHKHFIRYEYYYNLYNIKKLLKYHKEL